MRCPHPITLQTGEVPCGQCGNCMINRKRAKTARMLAERRAWQRVGQNDAVFVTLTYSPEHLPLLLPEGPWSFEEVRQGKQSVPRPTLRSEHVVKYLKRIRRHFGTRVIPNAYVSEYGDKTWRPHYHCVLYNVGLDDEEVLVQKWPYGHVRVDELNDERSAYVCGYISKKLTRPTPGLGGREPEKFRWSLRPAIGKKYVPFLVDMLDTKGGLDYIEREGDIIPVMRIRGRIWPLDRNMRNWCRMEWNRRHPDRYIGLEAVERPPRPQLSITLDELTDLRNQAYREQARRTRNPV